MTIAKWVGYPKSYTSGRIRPIQYIVVHYTAGSEGPTSAEAGAAYDKIRTDGVSTHVFVDSDSVCQEVPDGDRAHACFMHGNNIGLQMELCGTAQTRQQWLDATSLATLKLGAKMAAEWCRAYNMPVKHLTVAETRAAWFAPEGQRPKGLCGHGDVTLAYPEDPGTHTDPGPEFPWDVFLNLISIEMGQQPAPAPIVEDDVALIVRDNQNGPGAYYVIAGDGPHKLVLTPPVSINDVGYIASGRYFDETHQARPVLPYTNRTINQAPWIDIPNIPVYVLNTTGPAAPVTLPPDQLALVTAAAKAGAEAGAPTEEELVDAAFQGAQKAEDQ